MCFHSLLERKGVGAEWSSLCIYEASLSNEFHDNCLFAILPCILCVWLEKNNDADCRLPLSEFHSKLVLMHTYSSHNGEEVRKVFRRR